VQSLFKQFLSSSPDRLYFATLKNGYKPKPTRNSKYFHIEDEIVYENFYFDFGPYHLCHLHQFCNKLNEELEKNPRKKIVYYTSNNETLRLNAAYLIGSYQVWYDTDFQLNIELVVMCFHVTNIIIFSDIEVQIVLYLDFYICM
jgi:hypothetical protein